MVENGQGPQKAGDPSNPATAQTRTSPAVSHQRTARPALTGVLQGPTWRGPDSRGHGGCALWHSDVCRWGLGSFSWCTSDLTNPQQSEYSGRQASPTRG